MILYMLLHCHPAKIKQNRAIDNVISSTYKESKVTPVSQVPYMIGTENCKFENENNLELWS